MPKPMDRANCVHALPHGLLWAGRGCKHEHSPYADEPVQCAECKAPVGRLCYECRRVY